MPNFRNAPTWVWATVVGAVTVLSLITGMITVWNQIRDNTNEAVQTATMLITQEIHSQTGVIAEFYEDDLYERINILEAEIQQMQQNNQIVPVTKMLQLRSMKERLAEFKGR